MRFSFILIFTLIYSVSALAQSWHLIKQVEHKNIDQIAIDPMGGIYVTDEKGTITKYNEKGVLQQEFMPVQLSTVSQISVVSQFKLALFYKDLQEIVILDRYLSSPIRYRLSDFSTGYIDAVAASYQQSLWLVDVSDFSLKLLDVRTNRVIEQKSLAQVLNQEQTDILSFHFHQNRMYLADSFSGVQVFDTIGNYLFQLTKQTPSNIGFDKDYFYFVDGDHLKFIPLYEGEGFSRPLPISDFEKISYTNERLVLITAKGFDIYQYLSNREKSK